MGTALDLARHARSQADLADFGHERVAVGRGTVLTEREDQGVANHGSSFPVVDHFRVDYFSTVRLRWQVRPIPVPSYRYPAGMDVDLRKLRYFAAVAEHEHFGRAAEQLYIAQPVLSRQIRALERELGCTLLERTTRNVRLTAAGLQLRQESADLLVAAADATRRVHQAARGSACLVVGFAPGLSVAAAVKAYETQQPGIDIELLRLNWYEQAESLRDGRADVGYLRRPFDATGLTITTIGSEPSVVCLPTDHPLAAKRQLLQADLVDQTTLDAHVRRTTTIEEKLELVAAGHGLAVLPRSVAQYYTRPGLVHRQVRDAPGHDLCLALIKGHPQPHLRQFLAAATTTLNPTDLNPRVPPPAGGVDRV